MLRTAFDSLRHLMTDFKLSFAIHRLPTTEPTFVLTEMPGLAVLVAAFETADRKLLFEPGPELESRPRSLTKRPAFDFTDLIAQPKPKPTVNSKLR
jgi:hypothetical protein